MQLLEGDAPYANVGGSPAAVDDGARREYFRAHAEQQLNYLFRAAPGGNDIFDDDRFRSRGNVKTAAQSHGIAFGVALCEE
jgi:hypothetical protein